MTRFNGWFKIDLEYQSIISQNMTGGIQVKTTGIIRPVDGLGRIVLPIEIRRNLDIEERDQLEIFLEGDRIILRKHACSCVFCDGTRGLTEFRGKNVCRECIRHLDNL